VLSTVTGDLAVGQVVPYPDVPADVTKLALRDGDSVTVTVAAAGMDLPRELEFQVPAGTRAAVCVLGTA
jgi:hypothetical protein